MRHAPEGVKASNPEQATSQKPRGFRRHLAGYELGVVALTIAALAAALSVPRAVEPDVLPLPEVDRVTAQHERDRERARALAVQREPLPYAVRAVGETIRRYGRAETEQDHAQAGTELAELRRLSTLARKQHDDEPLLRLRAVQTELFESALRSWQDTGHQGPELTELGGDFTRKARASDWIRDPHVIVLQPDERATLFRMRWNELTGLRDTYPFSPSLNEWRTYYRCLLQRPQLPAEDREAKQRRRAEARLAYAAALVKHDSDYPIMLARGVLFYQLGDYARSSAELQGHLASSRSGPWQLRARNYLAAALERQRALAGDE